MKPGSFPKGCLAAMLLATALVLFNGDQKGKLGLAADFQPYPLGAYAGTGIPDTQINWRLSSNRLFFYLKLLSAWVVVCIAVKNRSQKRVM